MMVLTCLIAVPCRDGYVACDNQDNHQCINPGMVCDGTIHCKDNSDENNCPGMYGSASGEGKGGSSVVWG